MQDELSIFCVFMALNDKGAGYSYWANVWAWTYEFNDEEQAYHYRTNIY